MSSAATMTSRTAVNTASPGGLSIDEILLGLVLIGAVQATAGVLVLLRARAARQSHGWAGTRPQGRDPLVVPVVAVLLGCGLALAALTVRWHIR